MKYFYIAVANRTTGVFIGGLFIAGLDELNAVERGMCQRIIPDGPVACRAFEITELPPAKWLNKLCSKAELKALDRTDDN